MEVLTFALRRIGRLIITVFLISTIIFFVIRIIPGDPALVIAGLDASPQDIASHLTFMPVLASNSLPISFTLKA